MKVLLIDDLNVTVGQKRLLKGVSIKLEAGKLQVLVGPNGSGKSSLAQAIMGNPEYKVTAGGIWIGDQEISRLSAEKRAKLGLFLAFQNPVEVPGVKIYQLLRLASQVSRGDAKSTASAHLGNGGTAPRTFRDFLLQAKSELKMVGLEETFLERDLNVGFSGGEKKRSEVFQALILKPRFAILDEPDSGLDIDGQKMIAAQISKLVKVGTGVLLITHNPNTLKFLKPDQVYLMVEGQIVKKGGIALVRQIEKEGFEPFLKERLKLNRN